jgi:hypothetical protein
VLLGLCAEFTHKPGMSFNPKLATLVSNNHLKTQEALIEVISINYSLLPKSSLDICFNKLITNLRLIMLINCDCKIITETPENILLHTKLANCALSTRHLSLELSTNITNLRARNLKPFDEYICQSNSHCVTLYLHNFSSFYCGPIILGMRC